MLNNKLGGIAMNNKKIQRAGFASFCRAIIGTTPFTLKKEGKIMRIAFVPYLLFFLFSIQADVVYGQDEKKPTQEKDLLVWSKYDFIPGDQIIFEDNLQGEVNGEVPSKWRLQRGRAEIAEYGGEKVIYLIEDETRIWPLMKTEDYLPDVFTVEFDIFTEHSDYYYEAILKGMGKIGIGRGVISAYGFEGRIRQEEESFKKKWHHVAIAFNKRSLKVYFNENRILNIPNISEKPTAFGVGLFQTGGMRTSSLRTCASPLVDGHSMSRS